MEWCTIESDPGVFHEMIESLGVKGIEVRELWDMDAASLRAVEDLHGLVFLFKWQKDNANGPEDTRMTDHASGNSPWFARQLINNACATIAILNVLMNTTKIDLGPELSQLKSFSADAGMDEELKGLAISNSEVIRTIHNSFAKPEPMIEEQDKNEKGGETFHFISFIVDSGVVYELDGLKPAPVRVGLVSDGTSWVDIASSALKERISRYDLEAEVRFTLLAICGDTLQAARSRIQELEMLMEDETVAIQRESLREIIEEETEKRSRWKTDNIRRRHNFLPLLVNTLELLAEKDELGKLIERAKELTGTRNKLNV